MAVQPPNPASPVPLVRAANLGGWLVTEGWILPSLFDGIPNNDLQDDTQLQFRSVTQNAFIAVENGGGAALVANRASASGWESFKLGRIDTNTFNFKVFNDQFVTIAGVNAVATAAMAGKTETFQLVRNDVDKNRMRIRAPNGSFLQANKDGSVTANFGESTTWGDDDPSVFVVTIVNWVPSIFDGIPNKDLLDGTQLQFKSVTQNAFVAAENGGGAALVANRPSASGWESFKLWRIDQNTFNFKVSNNQFVTVSSVNMVATASAPGQTETFQLVRSYADKNRMRIRAPNGSFLQANKDGSVTANFGESTTWGDNDPSVFAVNIVNGPHGEYQICNGYGKDMATRVMNNHWSTYIVEADFAFMAANGLNAVRIPVGWWIASDPNPPAPFVGGSLQALDSAFTWAERHNIHVIIDLHAAPGSQNPNEHSGGRDGSQTWGDSQIAQTVQVIDFLAARYAKRSSLLAVELMNEPVAPGVSLDNLKSYYQQGYNAVRRHSLTAYVIMSNRLSASSLELIDFASQFDRVVLDMHYYALFDSKFDSFTVQDNIDYINNFIGSEINAINRPHGPLTFVGEWVAEWQVKDATKEDFQRFANAQMAVYRKATFGWAYWTYKNVNNHWSMQWMMDPYISLGNA
ncbi:probable glucan endo-1,6-beta-glucosidase B [Triticum dicoccoides]|uniref:probable glucan endo-1,6-beta-glucosidase B n=1 Tax=Triticum dicoccoides TaxID=85692 RepID=UPI00188FB11C|nr:probable glucan endo-1,6-beta-glucosidase B [Triticum dicoccoides]